MSPWFAFVDEVDHLRRLLYRHPFYEQFQVNIILYLKIKFHLKFDVLHLRKT